MAKRRARARRPASVRERARPRARPRAASAERAPAVRTAQAEFPLDLSAVRDQLPREAMRWRYIVEHRKRWTNVEKSAQDVTRDATQTLELLGLSRDRLAELAQQTVVEVSIPYVSEEASWTARLLPWEFLISSATRQMRGGGDFLIVRHLDFGDGGALRTPAKAAFIDAAPGRLGEQFDFEPEFKLVQQSFAEGGIPLSRIRNPTLADLQAQLAALSPDVIHLSAIDIRLARELSAESAQPKTQRRQAERPRSPDKEESGSLDGIVLHDLSSESFGEVRAAELGAALAAGRSPPLLVGFNSWYSASRVAPLALAAGVQAALSFSTDFSDPLAEMLFANFYRYWRLGNWNLLAGFLEAFKSLSAHSSKLRGTGVVLWSRQSLVTPVPIVATVQGRRAGKARAAATKKQLKALSEHAEKERSTDLELTELAVHEVVSVDVQPLKRINYSLLHNNGNLYEQFVIRKSKPGRLRGLEVEVRLHVGQDSFPFRRTFDLVDEATPLHDLIRLPLTSSLIRRVDENLATTIYTRVQWAGRTLYEETHRATLLPVDQWTDTDENRQWLPSFVLPRDPAIRKLLSSGQRYLMCLADDSGAGYDGYQQVDPSDADTLDAVDLQVRSMWTALLYEHPLAYINPPPSYEWTSQRLRTPSQVFGEGRGTCIDLALLLAACCEYVDIYPVLFLASGHAYPGYWRSEQGYAEFLSVQGVDGSLDQPDVVESRQSDKLPWIADSSTYREVLNHVAAGNLVPVETTMVASRTSFSTAVAEGAKNLRQKSDFHSLIDIRLARDCGITPLPLGDLT